MSPDSHLHPITLHQKIYRFAHNVCGAFAGSVSVIKQLIPDLYLFCRCHEEVSSAKLSPYLKERCQGIASSDLSFVIWILEKGKDGIVSATLPIGSWYGDHSPIIGEMNAAGSGAGDFLKAISANGSIKIPQGSFSNYQTVTAGYILFIAQMMAQEMATLSTIKKFWGAGFELVYPHNGSFQKLDNITYVINHGQFNSKGNLEGPVPLMIMHYKYHGEDLVITAIAIHHGYVERTGDTLILRNKDNHYSVQQFIVEPIYRDSPQTVVGLPEKSFFSDVVAMSYIFEDDKKKEHYMPAGLHRGSDVRVEYKHEEGISLTIKTAAQEILLAEVKKEYSHF